MQVDAPPDDPIEVQDEPDQPYVVENNAFVSNAPGECVPLIVFQQR